MPSEMSSSFKKLGGQSPKKQVVSVNFSSAVFCLVDMLTFKDGTNWLSHNISKELPFYTA
jgi:hypothetical protein